MNAYTVALFLHIAGGIAMSAGLALTLPVRRPGGARAVHGRYTGR